MGVQIPVEITNWEPIGNDGLVGAKYKGLIWIKGPCGQQHCMSLDVTHDLLKWLEKQLSIVIEETPE